MDIRDMLRVLGRSWRSVLALMVLGAFAGGAIGLLQPHRYAATARAFVSVSSAQTLTDLNSGIAYAQQAAQAYAGVATTAYVLRPVIADLDLADTPARLADRVRVTVEDDGLIVDLTVTDGSAAEAATIANAITLRLSTAAVDLTPDTDTAGTTTGSITLTPVDPAVIDRRPVGPGPLLITVFGALAGLVLSVAAALARDLLDTRVHTRQDLERVTTLPLLGATVRDPQIARHPLVVDAVSTGPRAEGYRTMRTNLRFLELDDAARSMVVTSSIDGEGKSVTAANIALAIAGLGRRVLLVDADLRRPRVARYFGIEGAIGLTDVLIGAVGLPDAIQAFGATGLDLLPAGTVPPNPNEQLQSSAMRELLRRLHADYDLVLFDTPPLLAVSDATVLAEQVGAVVLVAASGRVRRPQLVDALQNLERVDARIAGVVLTMVPRKGPDGYGYGYSGAPAATEDPSEDAGRRNATRPVTRRRRTKDDEVVVAAVAAALDPSHEAVEQDVPVAAGRRRPLFGRTRREPVEAPGGAADVRRAEPTRDDGTPETLPDAAPELPTAPVSLRAVRAAESFELDESIDAPTPRPALRHFARPMTWNAASVTEERRTEQADERQRPPAADHASPASDDSVEQDEARVGSAPRRRFTWRAPAPSLMVEEQASRSSSPHLGLVPVVAAWPELVSATDEVAPEAAELEPAPESAPQRPQTSVEPGPALETAPDVEPAGRGVRGRSRGRRSPSAATPIRIPPPPELAHRLHEQQSGSR